MRIDPASASNAFLLDVKGAQVRQSLDSAGIRTILLKGPSLTHHLHAGERVRGYADIDLLVDPTATGQAERVLSNLGFVPLDGESPAGQTNPAIGQRMAALGAVHGAAWVRHRDGVTIDLHHTLPQVAVDPELAWRALSDHIQSITVGGQATAILDSPASALLVTLHAAHHGPDWPKGVADVERAIDAFDAATWEQARALAVNLHASDAMGIGLGLAPGGADLAARLQLPTTPGTEFKLLWSGAPWRVSVLEAIASAEGTRERAGLIARLLFPEPAALRRGSALARKGPGGLLLAYCARLARIASRSPLALIRWLRLR